LHRAARVVRDPPPLRRGRTHELPRLCRVVQNELRRPHGLRGRGRQCQDHGSVSGAIAQLLSHARRAAQRYHKPGGTAGGRRRRAVGPRNAKPGGTGKRPRNRGDRTGRVRTPRPAGKPGPRPTAGGRGRRAGARAA
jgi:hypothetical protein